MATRRTKTPDGRMALVDHLREFRNRLTVAAIAIVIGMVAGWIYFDQILHYFNAPLQHAIDTRPKYARVRLVNTDITGPFTIHLQVAFFAGIIIASPVWLYEIWAFIFPGLTRREKRYAMAFIATAVPLFLLGCWTATLVLPSAVEMFLSFTAPEADNLLPIADYITWITRLIFTFGLAYLFPLVLIALGLMHVVTARMLLKAWRFAVIGILFFGALMSPTPDPWSMFALAVPLIGLYFVAIGVVALIDRRHKKAEPDWVDTPDDVASPL